MRKSHSKATIHGMNAGDFATSVSSARRAQNTPNNLYDQVAVAALPSASAETKAKGTGVTPQLGSHLKSGAQHPRATDANADAHTKMNVIFGRITEMMPDLHCLTNPELQKKDTKELNLRKEIDKNRPPRTGYHFINHSISISDRACSNGSKINSLPPNIRQSRKTWNSCRWSITV